jgi:branched-chain amino acid transport system permease protein
MSIFIQQALNGLMAGSIYALIALGLTLIFGLLGVLNFAQGQFVMMGAFATFVFVQAGASFALAMTGAVIGVAVLSLLLERFVFRPVQGVEINGLIVSVGLIGVFQNLVLLQFGTDARNIPPPFPGAARLFGIAFIWERLFIFAACLAVVAALLLFLRRSKWGHAMRATLQNRDAAALVGIPTQQVIATSFAISGAMAAAAGALLGTISPVDAFMGDAPLVKGFIVLVLGGVGSPLGAVIAGLLLGVAESLGAGYISESFKDAFGLVALVLVLLIRPRGILPERFIERAG